MINAFRIFKTKYASSCFDGEGAFRFGGRWNSPGTRIVYAAGSVSLAALELLVHLNNEQRLISYSLIEVSFDERLVMSVDDFRGLPKNWADSPAPQAIQRIGDDWSNQMASAVLKVPSAVIPSESNYLINIAHPKFGEIILGEMVPFGFDPRLST